MNLFYHHRQAGLPFQENASIHLHRHAVLRPGVPALRRHIFLDNIKTTQAMEKQLLAAIEIGKSNNAVVIIAHPYPETLQFLSDKFKQPQKQFELVALQALLSQTERLALAKKHKQRQQINSLVITEPVDVQPANLQ